MRSLPLDLTSLPVTHTQTIPASYLDDMGHMNVMWYTDLFSHAVVRWLEMVGMDRGYFESQLAGTFALEVHIRYLNEVHVGKNVTLRTRLLGRSAKRFHMMHFMSIDESGLLAATSESVGAHIDMTQRRMAAFPDSIAAKLDAMAAEHAGLSWASPVCGVMKP